MYKIEGPEDGGKAPKGPNFLLIVGLSGLVILIGLMIALLVTRHLSRSIHVAHPDAHPNSQVTAGPGRSEAV